MRAAVFSPADSSPESRVQIEEVPRPQVTPGHLLLRVVACGVCRTDLHIVEGDLPAIQPRLIPGHQIVGEVVEGGTAAMPAGTRVGVSWMGGTDGGCWYCEHGMENLCDHPTFTGYSVNGGYAEYALVRSDFAIPLPAGLDDVQVAPLLCAGIIGFRSLRVAGVEHGERVGLFGFGSSASLAIPILRAWKCEVYVVTRGASHQKAAASAGATWVGEENRKPPVELDRAITFAPSGQVVLRALGSLRKGGVVAINAIHLDQMPSFNYDTLLWGERQIRSVANMTRQDARDFLQIAHELKIHPQVAVFPLEEANRALLAVKEETENGSVVIVPLGSAVGFNVQSMGLKDEDRMSNVIVEIPQTPIEISSLTNEENIITGLIRIRAFELFEKSGEARGNDAENWVRAEEELLQIPHSKLESREGMMFVHISITGHHEQELKVVAQPYSLIVIAEPKHRHSKHHLASIGAKRIFHRINLSEPIDVQSVRAEFENGLLKISAKKLV